MLASRPSRSSPDPKIVELRLIADRSEQSTPGKDPSEAFEAAEDLIALARWSRHGESLGRWNDRLEAEQTGQAASVVALLAISIPARSPPRAAYFVDRLAAFGAVPAPPRREPELHAWAMSATIR